MKRVLAMVIILTLVLMVSSIFSQDPFSSGPGEDKLPLPNVMEAPPGVEEPPLEMYEPPLREEELYRSCPDCNCYVSGDPEIVRHVDCWCYIPADCAKAYIKMIEDQLEENFGESYELWGADKFGPCLFYMKEVCIEVDELRSLSEEHAYFAEVYREVEQSIKEDPSLKEVCIWQLEVDAFTGNYQDETICLEVLFEVLSHPCSELK